VPQGERLLTCSVNFWMIFQIGFDVVACVILQCTPCFYECRCMSDGVFIQFVCQSYNLIVIQIKDRQRFACIVFVDA
jgi:hypothetical protein